MNNFMKNYFGPLSKEYCMYFYFMSILFFILFLLSLLGIVTAAIYNPKSINIMFVVNGVMLLFNVFIIYFINRLLNTMCTSSLK